MIKKMLQEYYNGGFTLVELMVAMVISSLVIAGIFGIYTIQQRSYTVQEQVSELQQKGRSALDFMARDIRMAGYDDAANNCTSGDITTAELQRVIFQTCDGTGGTPVTVTYSSNGDLSRDVDGESELLLEGVDGFEFVYFKKDGTPLDSPVALGELDDIRTVQISMLVRSTYPDPKYTDSVTYKPGSWLYWKNEGAVPPEPATWSPPDRNFYRRLFITSVQLRNM